MRCAVLGDPVAHSLSPVLHRAAYDATGLDWRYDALRVAAGGLEGLVAGLGEEWRGLSVTMPLKREALDVAAEASPVAELAGAANTLVRGTAGWSADNTDVPGAVAALRERLPSPPVVATILGGGATAASTALALCELGAGSLTLLVRSPARAAETLAAIDAHRARPAVRVGSLETDDVVGDLVVSTIPAEAQSPGLVARCAGVPALFDVVYDPWPTPLVAAAGDRPLVTGLDLLVHQAALQFSLFTGLAAPLAEMRAAGEAALGRSR
ncbi:shikimate dehydrogenase [Nocardioides coralli]|uniref:shikimate dehydrogenase n=1 Tax=Nocardioides coralli TaxID=2872154 RepID=UPI001CA40B63|nr:shikimate dehydrogenase [Nocardioides coralli]QZY30500.1 shikimate dehydrogenase [Nocardioides coralli]